MKAKYAVVLSLLVSQLSFAQSVQDELNNELDQLYAQQNNGASIPVSGNTEVVNVPEAGRMSGLPVNNQAQPIYVIQQSQPAVQKQPTTVIESSPLRKSRADQMRESRQEVEMNTETQIVEKLEQSRIDDEKKRADVLFGDKFDQLNKKEAASSTEAVITPIQAAPVYAEPVQVQTIPVQSVEEVEIERPSLREEMKAALSDIQAEDQSRSYLAPKTYVGAIVGLADYPSIDNIKGQYSLGFNVGTKFKDRIVVEGSFIYSRFQVDRFYRQAYSVYPTYNNPGYSTSSIDMDQYTGAIAVKAQLFSGMLRPVVGGLLSYSYSQYQEDSFYADASTTHAIDVGVLLGADFDVDEEFSIGFDYRYMMNLSNRAENNNYTLSGYNGKHIEAQNRYIMSLIGKMSF